MDRKTGELENNNPVTQDGVRRQLLVQMLLKKMYKMGQSTEYLNINSSAKEEIIKNITLENTQFGTVQKIL